MFSSNTLLSGDFLQRKTGKIHTYENHSDLILQSDRKVKQPILKYLIM